MQFVWKARPAGFAFYDIVLSNDVTKMSFWFHFVGKKLVYRCYNFHDIILSTSAVITNDMQSNSNLFVKIWNQSTISCRQNKTIQKLFHEKFTIIFFIRSNLKSTVCCIQKYDIQNQNQPYLSEKIQHRFAGESPISAKTTGNWVETLAIMKEHLYRISKI